MIQKNWNIKNDSYVCIRYGDTLQIGGRFLIFIVRPSSNFLDLFYPPLGLINGSHSRLTKNPTARYTKGE